MLAPLRDSTSKAWHPFGKGLASLVGSMVLAERRNEPTRRFANDSNVDVECVKARVPEPLESLAKSQLDSFRQDGGGIMSLAIAGEARNAVGEVGNEDHRQGDREDAQRIGHDLHRRL